MRFSHILTSIAFIYATIAVFACAGRPAEEASEEAASSVTAACPKGKKPSRSCLDVCVADLHVGDACAIATCGTGCPDGATCTNGRCAAGGLIGDACIISSKPHATGNCSDGHYCAAAVVGGTNGTCR